MPTVEVIPPTDEPVTDEESWRHLRVAVGNPVTTPEDAADIRMKLSQARRMVEDYTGRSLCPRTLMRVMDTFPSGDIELEGAPVSAIESIVYVDEDGVEQTMAEADYQLDPYSRPPRVVLGEDTSAWPSTKSGRINAVRVRYSAGYDAPGSSPIQYPVPEPLVAAVLLALGHLYENREDTSPVKLEEIPSGACVYARPYVLHKGFA